MLPAKAKAAAKFAPAWHPNFRVAETLPDISPIRTRFFINGTAILLVLGLLAFGAQREFQAWSLQEESQDYRVRIEAGEVLNRQTMARNSEFKKLSRHAEELVEFMAAPVEIDELMLSLAETRPEGLILRQVKMAYREERIAKDEVEYVPVVTVKGLISGDSQETTPVFTSYKQSVHDLPLLAEKIDLMKESSNRNDDLNLLEFKLNLDLVVAEAKPKEEEL